MTNYVVRILMPDGIHILDPVLRTFLNLLDRTSVIAMHRDDRDGMCFDLMPPAGVDSASWATLTTGAFCDYGFNAVRAPACPND
jgi:hypothetical protein